MKKMLTIIAVLISAITSVLVVQYFIRKLYKRWNYNDYVDLSWAQELNPWERN